MKRTGIVVLLVGIIGAVWYLSRSKTSAATESATPPPPKPAPIARVTRLGSVEERKLLAERIEHARAERQKSSSGTGAAASARPLPRLPEAEPAISHVQMKAAMREVIPMIMECYEAAMPSLADTHLEIAAEMHLTGDPDIGTIIDAKQLSDQTGQPLPAVLDDCLRSTFQTLALPPLAEGDEIDVRYPFVFDKR